MRGKIIKGIGGFYYVPVPRLGILECRAKGIFRNQKVKPLVGDDVEVEVLDEEKKVGSITKIYPRRSQLIRPAVANVDQAVIVFALSFPKPNLNLLDRFLLHIAMEKLPAVICFNKTDDAPEDEIRRIVGTYENSGYRVLLTSAVTGEGLEELAEILRGKTTSLAGPSGVGKSSLMNRLFPEAEMETGSISEKIKRGKHTTRHTELFRLAEDTYIMDTPGFTSLLLPGLEKEDLHWYFPEFEPYEGTCRFQGCTHVHEPDCGVRQALERGEISGTRYDNYVQFFEELKNIKKY